jgi:hypothetical protein
VFAVVFLLRRSTRQARMSAGPGRWDTSRPQERPLVATDDIHSRLRPPRSRKGRDRGSESVAGGCPRASIGDRDVGTHNREEVCRAGIHRLVQLTDRFQSTKSSWSPIAKT